MNRHGHVSMPLLGAHSPEGHAHTFMAFNHVTYCNTMRVCMHARIQLHWRTKIWWHKYTSIACQIAYFQGALSHRNCCSDLITNLQLNGINKKNLIFQFQFPSKSWIAKAYVALSQFPPGQEFCTHGNRREKLAHNCIVCLLIAFKRTFLHSHDGRAMSSVSHCNVARRSICICACVCDPHYVAARKIQKANKIRSVIIFSWPASNCKY